MRTRTNDEEGNVIVEFIGITISLLVPISIIASACVSIASSYLSSDIAARTAVRAFVISTDEATAKKNAVSTARLVSDEYDSRKSSVLTKISCTRRPCLSPGGFVTVKVSRDVALNLPRVFGSREITVTSQHTLVVDELRAR
jgi:hypothetical protein